MIKQLTTSIYYKLDEVCPSRYQRSEKRPPAQRVLRRERPPHATIRLIPKPNGMRPICNLGKKQRVVGRGIMPTNDLPLNAIGPKQVQTNGRVQVGPSINETLADAHQVLTYEKASEIDPRVRFALLHSVLSSSRNGIMRSCRPPCLGSMTFTDD
jgi:hypothetical protein